MKSLQKPGLKVKIIGLVYSWLIDTFLSFTNNIFIIVDIFFAKYSKVVTHFIFIDFPHIIHHIFFSWFLMISCILVWAFLYQEELGNIHSVHQAP